MTNYLYSGYISCGGREADYEFEADEEMDALEQLQFLLDSGTLQIFDDEPQEI